ncbi:type II toxin-antitoxin system VapC family toxin [Paraoerskovia marina]|uniref:type II toxin-antitoxin system VapC family toxin n=1 Tax=Paraoerskovia marina TaxID=545619 RepID=UPI0004927FB7|nr:type II toxin-antitoxin system VapC family toxin [Paraoerskovia marina]
MTFLLDTNVLSELRKRPGRRDENVATWADSQPLSLLYTSVICLMEIERGVLQRERSDARQGAVLRRWLEETLLPAFDGRVLPLDLPASRLAAARHVPDPRPERDCLIAATARVRGFTVVTRNVLDFASTGVALVNPWTTT